MAKDAYRPEGRYITAQDVADRLLPDLYIHEVLLWPPDLFAYTSYVLMMTSAYQLVVSPPSRRKWQPGQAALEKWLVDDAEANLRIWLTQAVKDWNNELAENWLNRKVRAKVRELSTAFKAIAAKYRRGLGTYHKGKLDRKPTFWNTLVEVTGDEWQAKLDELTPHQCDQIDDTVTVGITRKGTRKERSDLERLQKTRGQELLNILLDHTPILLLASWSFFYSEVTRENFYQNRKLQITELLCNRDDTIRDPAYRARLWKVSQALLTMHAIADIAGSGFGLSNEDEPTEGGNPKQSWRFAHKLLFGRAKGVYEDQMFFSGGSLSTFNTERVRILPKRHNPPVGITLRSISSNLAFHQSSVDVVWRKARNNPLSDRLVKPEPSPTSSSPVVPKKKEKPTISVLLFPFPLTVRTKDFREDGSSAKRLTVCEDGQKQYFAYDPRYESREKIRADEQFPRRVPASVRRSEEKFANAESKKIRDLIRVAKAEHLDKPVDVIIFPEAALNVATFRRLEKDFVENEEEQNRPSLIIAGVRESQSDIVDDDDRPQKALTDVNFPRNAVYCKYYYKALEPNNPSGYYRRRDRNKADVRQFPALDTRDRRNPLDWPPLDEQFITPRFKQYKHHRWHLNKSQIQQYGLTSVLDPDLAWYESIKVPKRRVSFLNLGNRLTISHLICEDLARQDPIAELIRHVGPSLVVAILMDGPQLKTRWSARYATVLADDPGCSVITLTSIGMAHRHSSQFGLMSRVIGLWNDSTSTNMREIELDYGAEAVLLTLEVGENKESTADGRTEEHATSVLSLQDVIQIYPEERKEIIRKGKNDPNSMVATGETRL